MFEWVTNNWLALTAAVIAGLAFARTVVALTPSKIDDDWEAKIEAVVLGILNKK